MSEDSRAAALFEQLLAVQTAFQANLERRGRAQGLSTSQAAVAQDLALHPGTNLAEVCARLGWPKSTVSRLVEELVQAGLATRTIPADNRRTVALSMASEAQSTCGSDLGASFFPGAPDGITAADAELLRTALGRLLDLLKT